MRRTTVMALFGLLLAGAPAWSQDDRRRDDERRGKKDERRGGDDRREGRRWRPERERFGMRVFPGSQGGQTAMTSDAEYLYLFTSGVLLKIDKKTLKVVARRDLRDDLMGRRGRDQGGRERGRERRGDDEGRRRDDRRDEKGKEERGKDRKGDDEQDVGVRRLLRTVGTWLTRLEALVARLVR